MKYTNEDKIEKNKYFTLTIVVSVIFLMFDFFIVSEFIRIVNLF